MLIFNKLAFTEVKSLKVLLITGTNVSILSKISSFFILNFFLKLSLCIFLYFTRSSSIFPNKYLYDFCEFERERAFVNNHNWLRVSPDKSFSSFTSDSILLISSVQGPIKLLGCSKTFISLFLTMK